ncbi:MAG TPA: di-heme oxidoredictase family protein, partial [Thermoanaerobaculia bacterium]|nr:di-heme oxidoredictase family protein [Thermoanaerobaculia bacterium]
RVSQGGEAATIRAFYTGAADVHMGLQAFDPSQLPTAGGLARVSLAGAQQYALGGSVDPGLHQTSTGLSLDDPDGDHHPSELVEGDVDAVEFYMLHAPAPAVRATADTEPGRKLLAEIGCTRCHVESWQIEGRDPARGLAGDRRLFRLELSSRPAADGSVALVGRLVRQFRRTPSGGYEPLGGPFRVQGLYTDFKHWDVGPRFWERRFDGSVQKEHRTAPLWGVGSTAPYGHTGEFLSLEEVIEAHDGEALREREAYDRLEPAARRTLIEFLKSLVLYATDEIPADIDGDGSAAESFQVGGVDVGYERFDARWLAADPPRYRALDWLTDAYGRKRRLVLLDNPAEVFGLDLPARKDSDGDGFPDAMDPTPNRPGLSDETPATSH